MQRFRTGVLALTVSMVLVSSGCVATRKHVRNEIKTSSDEVTSRLTAQIDATNGQVKETQDSVNRVNTRVTDLDQRVTTVDQKLETKVASVDGKVTALDTRTTQSVTGLKTEVSGVNAKADSVSKNVTVLDQKFQNRNNYAMSTQKSVLFRFDSDKLTDDNKAPLDEIAQVVQSNPDAILVLEGHTDNSGDRNYNIKLGERRIEAVRRYLAVDKGVPVYKIEQISFGSEKPVAANDSKVGREQNRSVTLTILVPSMEAQATAANR